MNRLEEAPCAVRPMARPVLVLMVIGVTISAAAAVTGACGSESTSSGDVVPDIGDTGGSGDLLDTTDLDAADSDAATVSGEDVCKGLAQAICGSLVTCGCGDADVATDCETRVETECATAGAAEARGVGDRHRDGARE